MNYEVNLNTMVILPLSLYKCKVMEINNEFTLEVDPFSVIKRSCEYFGCSYNGRHKGTKHLIGVTHKSPVCIEESSKMIFFPTTSPLREDCIWIALNHIKKYIPKGEWNTLVEFKTGDSLELNMSIGSFTNQVLRATRLLVVLSDRAKALEKNQ